MVAIAILSFPDNGVGVDFRLFLVEVDGNETSWVSLVPINLSPFISDFICTDIVNADFVLWSFLQVCPFITFSQILALSCPFTESAAVTFYMPFSSFDCKDCVHSHMVWTYGTILSDCIFHHDDTIAIEHYFKECHRNS